MDEINSNQESDLNNNNNLQDMNQFYNNLNNNPKNFPKKYIIGSSILIILYLVFFGTWLYIFIFHLLWLMYWIFKFYKKVSWQRYNYSVISLIIIGVIAGIPTYNFSGSNMWNFLPLIHLAVTFVLLIIWSVIIVPIFILYHRTKDKDKLNNINLLKNVDINTHNNYSDNINQLNSNKNINIVISIFLILFLLFIFNLLFSVLWGETLWNFIVNGINFIWSWIFVYSR
jgi:hypothetical protein